MYLNIASKTRPQPFWVTLPVSLMNYQGTLNNLGEIENYDISGDMTIYLYTYYSSEFEVELYDFMINGQNVYWDSNNQRFYK